MDYELYLPESEAAELLGCHYRHVRYLAGKGVLGYIIINNRLKIAEKSVRRMIKIQNDLGQ